jgi:formylglycine-generating enzyme required for sulfatase activity
MHRGNRNPKTWLACALLAGCTESTYGEAIVHVDTDLPPRLAQQLRVDVYSEDGRWIESRQFSQSQPIDWPASFSVQAPIDGFAGEAMLRLRLFPTGRTRDYLGERFDTPVFVPALVPTTLEEACAAPRGHAVGEARWYRIGETPLVGTLASGCPEPYTAAVGGAVGRVDITELGTYRFEVLRGRPRVWHWALQLRRSCADQPSAATLGCDLGSAPGFGDHGPAAFEIADLPPGSYHLVAVGDDGTALAPSGLPYVPVAPIDLLVGVQRLDVPSGLVEASDAPEPPIPDVALELEGGGTPLDEPRPAVTVDRLVRVPLDDGVRGATTIVLRGSCLGVQAKLRADTSFPRPVFDEAESCIDTPGQRASIAPSELAPDDTVVTSQLGQFLRSADQACGEGSSNDRAVCVPGGVFLFGTMVGSLSGGSLASRPERAAVVQRFWIDRREVTLARWRKAMLAGFSPPPSLMPYTTGDPFPPEGATDTKDTLRFCTWTDDPGAGQEDWPLTCVRWRGARAFCQFAGGDLPSLAQWEYVATAAGRPHETLFPWGDDPPRCSPNECVGAAEPCHAAVYERVTDPQYDECLVAGYGPTPVGAYEAPLHGDRTVAFDDRIDAVVFGLAGGAAEATLDSHHPFDGACWRAAPLFDPVCWEEVAALRERRGGAWLNALPFTYAATRGTISESDKMVSNALGFRCAYRQPPPP